MTHSIVLCVYCRRPKTTRDGEEVELFLDAEPCSGCHIATNLGPALLLAAEQDAVGLTGNYVALPTSSAKKILGTEYGKAASRGYFVLGPHAWYAATKAGVS